MTDYILDTNVILHDCQSVFAFEEHNVIIPMTVQEELDTFKKSENELGRNARHFSKLVDELRSQGCLIEGVPVAEGTLRVAFAREDALALLPDEMDRGLADNRILAVALFNQRYSPYPTVLVTNDTNMRLKADALGLFSEPYEAGKINFDELYTGSADYDALDMDVPYPNMFVRKSDGETKRYDATLNGLVPLAEDLKAWGLEPRNAEQQLAMDLLLNDDIKLVTLVGKAGTGKTLLAVAAGLRKVTDEFVYKKLLVSRPVMPLGKDIGFLPGDIEEKMSPYMQPIYDNVEFLMAGYVPSKSKKKRRAKEFDKDDEGLLPKGHMELVAAGIMEIEPLTYIRGRSIPTQFMVVDEAQNLTPHEIKTIVTRVGTDTKLVFTGDPHQIDNPYLDASNNGLTYLVDRFKTEKIAGHVTLTQGERSELAEIASNIL